MTTIKMIINPHKYEISAKDSNGIEIHYECREFETNVNTEEALNTILDTVRNLPGIIDMVNNAKPM